MRPCHYHSPWLGGDIEIDDIGIYPGLIFMRAALVTMIALGFMAILLLMLMLSEYFEDPSPCDEQLGHCHYSPRLDDAQGKVRRVISRPPLTGSSGDHT